MTTTTATSRSTTHVWYAAYGSNCDDARFSCYLAGGRPAGSTKQHHGCRDTAPPTQTAAIRLDYPVYFGGHSPYWNGAIAWLDPHVDTDAATLAVARRITLDQFGDIVAQESGGTVLSAALPIDHLVEAGRIDVGGVYGTVLYAGMRHGEPVVTCTSSGRRPAGSPTGAYIDTIRRGLGRFHPAGDLDGYLDTLTAAAPPADPHAQPDRRPDPRRRGGGRQLRLVDDVIDHVDVQPGPIDDHVERWEDLHLADDLDDVVLDGDTLADRAAINRYLYAPA